MCRDMKLQLLTPTFQVGERFHSRVLCFPCSSLLMLLEGNRRQHQNLGPGHTQLKPEKSASALGQQLAESQLLSNLERDTNFHHTGLTDDAKSPLELGGTHPTLRLINKHVIKQVNILAAPFHFKGKEKGKKIM